MNKVRQSLFQKANTQHCNDFSYQPLHDEKLQVYVSFLGKKLIQHTSIQQVDFHVLATNYVQGFTNYSDVYVTVGMLNTISNEAELVGLLTQEIGHIGLKHI